MTLSKLSSSAVTATIDATMLGRHPLLRILFGQHDTTTRCDDEDDGDDDDDDVDDDADDDDDVDDDDDDDGKQHVDSVVSVQSWYCLRHFPITVVTTSCKVSRQPLGVLDLSTEPG